LLDREMWDCYITVLHAVDPEEADRLESFYTGALQAGDKVNEEELAGMLIEALAEHELAPELWKEV